MAWPPFDVVGPAFGPSPGSSWVTAWTGLTMPAPEPAYQRAAAPAAVATSGAVVAAAPRTAAMYGFDRRAATVPDLGNNALRPELDERHVLRSRQLIARNGYDLPPVLRAPAELVRRVAVAVGDQARAGDVLAVVE